MSGMRWWGLPSAAAALVLLVGGWTVAAALQPSFDPVEQTISALAGYGARRREVMTVALIGVGVCHVLTAWALRPAAPAGRLVLALGGIGTTMVALTPLPADDSGSAGHTAAAALAFLALAAWPAGSWRRSGRVPWALRPRPAIGAAGVLFALLAWFLLESLGEGHRIGLAERVVAAAQAGWPLAVVLAVLSVRAGTIGTR